jgi:outer membrane protein assembly factor BamB
MAIASDRTRPVLVLASVLCLAAPGLSQDWPQWRGSNRDGAVHGVKVPARWPKALKQQWKVEVGEGVASPVLAGGRVHVFARQKDSELVLCFDLAGKELWRSEPYPAPYRRGAGEGIISIGPRSTPAIASGRVYAFGMTGVLSCLDAATGKLLWRKECKPCLPYGGNSPLVGDGLCIVHFGDSEGGKSLGGVTAFDAATGEVKWCFTDGSRASSSSPVLATLAEKRQVVLFSAWDCSASPPTAARSSGA